MAKIDQTPPEIRRIPPGSDEDTLVETDEPDPRGPAKGEVRNDDRRRPSPLGPQGDEPGGSESDVEGVHEHATTRRTSIESTDR
jgi:hypothetical protein